MDKRIKRLNEISKELFTIANNFASDDFGTGAVELHRANNRLLNAVRILTTGATIEDKKAQIREHLANSPLKHSAESIEMMVNELVKA